MPIPALIAALGTVAGGAIGAAAMNSTNNANKQIARETNYNQMLMQERANAFSERMQRQQQLFASPANQRKMLEEAGFNPYLYASQSAHAASSPQGAMGAALHAPQMLPNTSMADAVSSASMNAANVYSTIANAKKAEAEATNININNEYQADILEQSLRLMGNEEAAQAVKLTYLNQKESLSTEELQNIVNTQNVQLDDLRLTYEINKEFKRDITQAQLNNIIESTNLLKEEGLTQSNLRNYYDKMAEASFTSAQAQSLLAWLEKNMFNTKKEYYESQTRNIDESTEFQSIRNAIERNFGAKTAEALLELYNKQGWVNEEQAKRILHENGSPDDLLDFGSSIIGAVLGSLGAKGLPKPTVVKGLK